MINPARLLLALVYGASTFARAPESGIAGLRMTGQLRRPFRRAMVKAPRCAR
jgi:hypothetical protein